MNKSALEARKKRLLKKTDWRVKDWRENKYKCPDCDYRFGTKIDLKMHSYNHYEKNNVAL